MSFDSKIPPPPPPTLGIPPPPTLGLPPPPTLSGNNNSTVQKFGMSADILNQIKGFKPKPDIDKKINKIIDNLIDKSCNIDEYEFFTCDGLDGFHDDQEFQREYMDASNFGKIETEKKINEGKSDAEIKLNLKKKAIFNHIKRKYGENIEEHEISRYIQSILKKCRKKCELMVDEAIRRNEIELNYQLKQRSQLKNRIDQKLTETIEELQDKKKNLENIKSLGKRYSLIKPIIETFNYECNKLINRINVDEYDFFSTSPENDKLKRRKFEQDFGINLGKTENSKKEFDQIMNDVKDETWMMELNINEERMRSKVMDLLLKDDSIDTIEDFKGKFFGEGKMFFCTDSNTKKKAISKATINYNKRRELADFTFFFGDYNDFKRSIFTQEYKDSVTNAFGNQLKDIRLFNKDKNKNFYQKANEAKSNIERLSFILKNKFKIIYKEKIEPIIESFQKGEEVSFFDENKQKITASLEKNYGITHENLKALENIDLYINDLSNQIETFQEINKELKKENENIKQGYMKVEMSDEDKEKRQQLFKNLKILFTNIEKSDETNNHIETIKKYATKARKDYENVLKSYINEKNNYSKIVNHLNKKIKDNKYNNVNYTEKYIKTIKEKVFKDSSSHTKKLVRLFEEQIEKNYQLINTAFEKYENEDFVKSIIVGPESNYIRFIKELESLKDKKKQERLKHLRMIHFFIEKYIKDLCHICKKFNNGQSCNICDELL
jgi:hypothetical protein